MDTNLTYIIIVGILAVIALVAFFQFRKRTKVDINGPFGTGLKADATNKRPHRLRQSKVKTSRVAKVDKSL